MEVVVLISNFCRMTSRNIFIIYYADQIESSASPIYFKLILGSPFLSFLFFPSLVLKSCWIILLNPSERIKYVVHSRNWYCPIKKLTYMYNSSFQGQTPRSQDFSSSHLLEWEKAERWETLGTRLDNIFPQRPWTLYKLCVFVSALA